jgi:hypothetical protein
MRREFSLIICSAFPNAGDAALMTGQFHRPKFDQALEFPRRGIGGSRSKYIDESLASSIGTQVDAAERATVGADEFGVAGEQDTGPQFEDRWPWPP